MRAEYSDFDTHLAAHVLPSTALTYRRIARAFIAFLDLRPVADTVVADIERFLARPRRTGSPASISTRNLEIVALRALFAVGRPAHGDPTTGIALRRPERRDPSVPTASELRSLFETAARGRTASRDLAMLALLFQAGLRVHELVALGINQIDAAGRTIVDLRGKGGTRTDQPLGEEAALLVEAWIAERGATPGPLFARTATTAVSVRSVQRLLARLRREAGITKRLTPHSLRHGTATMAIARGVDLPTTAALMRHARVETTMLYVALASEARRDAANRLGGAIPRSVLPAPRNHSESRPSRGVGTPLDAEDEFCDAASMVAREGALLETSQKSVASPPAPHPGAGFVLGGGSRARPLADEVERVEDEADGNGGVRQPTRCVCGGCSCGARGVWRRRWYARWRERDTDRRSDR